MQSIDDRIEILLSEIEKNNNRFKEIIDTNELLLKSRMDELKNNDKLSTTKDDVPSLIKKEEKQIQSEPIVKARVASFDDVVLEQDKIKVINVDTNEEKTVLATPENPYGCFIGQKIGTLKIINSINYQLVDIKIDKRLAK